MVRNWQAREEKYVGLKAVTSLLDEIGFKAMTLQSHHWRATKEVQVLLGGSETL